MTVSAIESAFSGERRYTPETQFTGTIRAAGSPPPTPAMTGASWLSAYFGDIFGGSFTSVAEDAYTLYLQTGSIEQALDFIRKSDAYKARFPGMAALQKAGRPISEGAYLDLERNYAQIARTFDLPPGFYDQPDDFAKLIGGEVSPVEWQRRLTAWQTYERETRDPVAEQAIRQQFAAAGLVASDGDFLAAAIDPTKAVSAIERRLEAGLVSAQAVRSGYGGLSIEEGLTLADRGVTRDQAAQGFGALADAREVFAPLPGEIGADTIGRQTQLDAAFAGDSMARRRIEQQRRRRQAEFEGGGGVTGGRSGLAGLGSA